MIPAPLQEALTEKTEQKTPGKGEAETSPFSPRAGGRFAGAGALDPPPPPGGPFQPRGFVLQRKCGPGKDCDEDEKKAGDLQRSATPGAATQPAVPRAVHDVLSKPGRPLDRETRSLMEPRLGHDLGRVRIHTDGQAAESARSVNALAYTVGQQVVFGPGRYDPWSPLGRKLLAHELVHTVQQGGNASPGGAGLRIGREGDVLEQEADRAADQVLRGRVLDAHPATGPVLQRAVTVGWPDSVTGSQNAKETTVGNIRRIPLDGLGQGNQEDDRPNPKKPDPGRDKDRSRESAKGRAIVLLRKGFKPEPDKPVEVLLHFHGWNSGNRWSAAANNPDEDIYHIEQQMDAANKPNLVGVLPQGNSRSWFGESGGQKAFNSDAYIKEVLDALKSTEGWASVPHVSNVMISGHSGAGELINEKLLGGAAGSSLPSAQGTLKEVALFDAVNGPHEFLALEGWLDATLQKDLAALKASSTDTDRLRYLSSSTRFRSYFHIHKDKDPKKSDLFYSKWNIGPLPSDPQVAGKKPLQSFLDEWFKANASGFSQPVVDAWHTNYQVINLGDVAHEAVMTSNNPATGTSSFQESLGLFPKREPGAREEEAPEAPELVREALGSPAKSLGPETQVWARNHFGVDFSGVKVHTGTKAAESARSVNSLAYTVGNHVVFGRDRYEPETPAGRRLLAHELAHVSQQGIPAPLSGRPARLKLGNPHDPAEKEADLRSRVPGPIRAAAPPAAPVIRRAPPEGQLAKDVCETTKNPPKEEVGECNYARPENCASYESWLSAFSSLKSFKARATPTPTTTGSNVFDVVGDAPATRLAPKPDEKAMTADPKAPPFPLTGLQLGEVFMDHPTDEWVKQCLPENLRITAYQLPADCADIAIVLRHVWLSAHHRTQTIQWGTESWVIGDLKGGAAKDRAKKAILGIGSGSVQALVAPYSDSSGESLLTFDALEPLLHPGDILVWEHRDEKTLKTRSGGHTQTITKIIRDTQGRIESLSLVQGNQPIFGDRCDPKEKDPLKKAECEEQDDKGKILKKLHLPDTDKSRKEMGDSPGRRIEATGMNAPFLSRDDPKRNRSAWFIDGDTFLVAAGPPRATERPAAAKPAKGAKAERRLSDWIKPFKAAPSYPDWQAVLESMLQEARAFIEGGRDIPEDEARQVGDAAGGALWKLAKGDKAKPNLGDESHFARLMEARRMIDAIRFSRDFAFSPNLDSAQDLLTDKLMKTLRWIRESLDLAARGASDISFGAGGKSTVKVLLTGFDPFVPSGNLGAPAKGEWNPSGAAVLALDNQEVAAQSTKGLKGAAHVQGVILPVSFGEFEAGGKGLVESIVSGKAPDLDAAITVSLDPNLQPGDPVRLERYVVGTHEVPKEDASAQTRQVLEPIPAAGGGSLGGAILESNAPLKQIAAETADPKNKAGAIGQPALGEEITFRFSPAQARAAVKDLKGTVKRPESPNDVTIKDEGVLHDILSSMRRQPNGTDITFTAGGADFAATVVEGPGGNFLSNEVSFRMLRLLQDKKFPQDPLSFHVHTPGTDPITQVPTDKGTPESKKSVAEAKKKQSGELKAAGSLLNKLVETLKRIIASTAKVVLDRRESKKP